MPAPSARKAKPLFFLWVNAGNAPPHPTLSEVPVRPTAPCTGSGASRLIAPLILLITLLFLPQLTEAQRLNFGLFAGEDITIEPVMGSGTLDFNARQSAIVPGDNVIISLQDDAASLMAVFTITAPIGFDLDVVVTETSPGVLRLEPPIAEETNEIPFTFGWAFSNNGFSSETDALTDARANVIPAGIRFATFPVIRRNGNNGPPGPPPRPLDGNSDQRPTQTAYLFFFGSIEVPENARVGLYNTQIDIHVSYNRGDEL
ncbi:hypothetical protein [Cyclonatronum proteinivorum]|nr:hypothetical protein [Cyclonatronum proteinivorum]